MCLVLGHVWQVVTFGTRLSTLRCEKCHRYRYVGRR